jgi:hypothetical protein
MIAPSSNKASLFRALNPELFVERTKNVSPAGWLVTAMVGFVVVTIGYTQWEHTRTTKQNQATTQANRLMTKEQRKDLIRQQLDREEGPIGGSNVARRL